MKATKCPACGERFFAQEDHHDTLRLTSPTIPPPPPVPSEWDREVRAWEQKLRRPRRWWRIASWFGLGCLLAIGLGAMWVKFGLDAAQVETTVELRRSNERLQQELEELRLYLRNQHIQSL